MNNSFSNNGNISGLQDLLGTLSGKKKLQAEKARLEAFLAAVPGEYCGWSPDGSVAYSKGFCSFLGLERVTSLIDIQNQLSSGDSAALEGLFNRLQEDGISFSLNVQDVSGKKMLKISGVCGKDFSGNDHFNILWLEDVTQQNAESSTFAEEQKIQREELDRLQDSLDCLPFPVWVRDKTGKIIWCNIAYAKRIDARPSEILSLQKELIPSSRKKKVGQKDAILTGPELALKALEKRSPQFSKAHVVLGGTRILMKITESPLPDGSMTVGFAEDLTEQEHLTSELKNNREANRGLLEQLRSSIAIYDSEQKLEFYNSAFAQMWGLEEGWLNTKPKLGDILEKLRETRRLPEQADFRKYKKLWLDMFTSLIEPYEDMLYLPSGSVVRMLVVPHKVGGIMMNFEDVTSRLELESSYNTLIAVQKETLDNLAESVTVFGGDGRLKLWNPSFGRLWDLNPEDLEGGPHITNLAERMKHLFSEDEWKDQREILMGMVLDRTMTEGRQRRVDGTLVDYSTVPLPDGGVLITYTDVTDSVRVENALREKNAALEAAERLKTDFLANVSYQLRTPLNAIMGFNEILDQEYFGPLNVRQKGYTRDIKDSSERLLSLINDILDLASFEAGYLDLQLGSVDISSMLNTIVDLVNDWARKQKIELSLQCDPQMGSGDLDESRMKQVMLNILHNAIAHTPEGGKITVRAKRRVDVLEIIVADTGLGIPVEEQDRILRPFERIETQQGVRGVGLGLTLVQNIIKLHKGQFSLHSAPGAGTVVSLSIPLKQANS